MALFIDIYTLLYIKEIPKENLLYSAGNSVPCSVVIQMGIQKKRMPIAGSFCCISRN